MKGLGERRLPSVSRERGARAGENAETGGGDTRETAGAGRSGGAQATHAERILRAMPPVPETDRMDRIAPENRSGIRPPRDSGVRRGQEFRRGAAAQDPGGGQHRPRIRGAGTQAARHRART